MNPIVNVPYIRESLAFWEGERDHYLRLLARRPVITEQQIIDAKVERNSTKGREKAMALAKLFHLEEERRYTLMLQSALKRVEESIRDLWAKMPVVEAPEPDGGLTIADAHAAWMQRSPTAKVAARKQRGV